MKFRITAIVFVIVIVAVAIFSFSNNGNSGFLSGFPFKLGLDLAGGTELVYSADVSKLESSDVGDAMTSLRDVIERRVNVFGVGEPVIQVEESSLSGQEQHRLIVELPGITDIDQAVALIGKTPLLEFKLLSKDADLSGEELSIDSFFDTGLTGSLLKHASLDFGGNGQSQVLNEPVVRLQFNDEGADLFAQITRENVGEILAIFLDGAPISTPVIQQEITGGSAVITGQFTPDEAKQLVRDLNLGALPVPIELVGTQSVGATLGHDVLVAGVRAGIIGFALIVLFLILWYRLPGLLAAVSLVGYIALMLALFKIIPVTITAAAVAGLIMSIGIAVDANVLIFERMKDELREGKIIDDAIRAGFSRAWFSVRDSNISSIITAIILFWLGTSLVKGFALVLAMGVVVNMLTAIIVTKIFLLAISPKAHTKTSEFLFGVGSPQ